MSADQELNALRAVYDAIRALPESERPRILACALILLGLEGEVAARIRRADQAMRDLGAKS